MSISYRPLQIPLRTLIDDATVSPTVLVPDLQRAFVWEPSAVRFLVDSILRGWPFGSLLLWEIKATYYDQGEGIPSRPFWRDLIDRTQRPLPAPHRMAAPAVYQMVLDGQQRVQSLLIAFGEDSCGFKLHDHDWVLDLKQSRRDRTAHWSHGSLCVDLEAFETELARCGNAVRRMETSPFLSWVVRALDHQSDRSESNQTLPRAWKSAGRYIRLSRLWRLADGALSEEEYSGLLRLFFEKEGVAPEVSERIISPFSIFVRRIADVRAQAKADCLQIDSFSISRNWTRDDYNDAIVNIFTRLNTGGRILTREEVTMAWLKVGWVAGPETQEKSAGDCLGDLHASLAEAELVEPAGPLDEVVRTVSFLWAVVYREGRLLGDRDLMSGDVIRPMAATVSGHWALLSESLKHSIVRVRSRGYETKTLSFNSFIVSWCWKYLADRWLDSHKLMVKPEHNYQAWLHSAFGNFLDRWQFASHWSSVWSQNAVQNFQTFAERLHKLAAALDAASTPDEARVALERGIEELMAHKVEEEAIQHVQSTRVTARSRVSTYRSEL